MTDQPALDIGGEEWNLVSAILQRHVPDHEVWAFGSRAKHTARPFSDLDLAVMGNVPLTPGESANLADAFADSDLPWKVDVLDWATTSESFRRIIAQDKVVVQSKSIGLSRAGLPCEAGRAEGKGRSAGHTDSGEVGGAGL